MNDVIIVLKTLSPDSTGEFEYRVNWVADYDSLFGPYNEITNKYDVNVDYILDHFTEVPIWTSIDLALDEADRIYFVLGHEPENGILIFSNLSDKLYTEI